jgi:hypothetical protein
LTVNFNRGHRDVKSDLALKNLIHCVQCKVEWFRLDDYRRAILLAKVDDLYLTGSVFSAPDKPKFRERSGQQNWRRLDNTIGRRKTAETPITAAWLVETGALPAEVKFATALIF